MTTSETAPYAQLAEHAYQIRRNALRMGEVQGQGYIGQALDIADVLAVAYFRAMRFRAQWHDQRDLRRFQRGSPFLFRLQLR